MNKLPDKPSALIRLALDDLSNVEGHDDYVVDFDSYWHGADIYPEAEMCSVCWAGSVIARTLGVPPDVNSSPTMFDKNTRDKLCALNRFRSGANHSGLLLCGLSQLEALRVNTLLVGDEEVPSYEDDPPVFHSHMHWMADQMEAQGY